MGQPDIIAPKGSAGAVPAHYDTTRVTGISTNCARAPQNDKSLTELARMLVYSPSQGAPIVDPELVEGPRFSSSGRRESL